MNMFYIDQFVWTSLLLIGHDYYVNKEKMTVGNTYHNCFYLNKERTISITMSIVRKTFSGSPEITLAINNNFNLYMEGHCTCDNLGDTITKLNAALMEKQERN